MRVALIFFLVCLGIQSGRAEVRSFDGLANNSSQPTWGAADTKFTRMGPAAYRDGIGNEIDTEPNPRAISNQLYAQVGSIPNTRHLSSMTWQWGQFIDHDMTLSMNGPQYGSAPVMTPQPDPDGMTMIPFQRTQYDLATGSELGNPRQQINSVSSYLDASGIYGTDRSRADALRSFAGGRLKASGTGRGLLPTNAQDASLAAQANDDGGLVAATLFVAGDIRANEQPGLIAMHTLFMREHNRLADHLAAIHQGDVVWNDERIYQTARKIVGAEIQAITYNEFLPAVLGSFSPSAVAGGGYQPGVNASVNNGFATAFYRFGHSMLTKELLMMDDGAERTDTMGLRDSFFHPMVIMDAADPDAILDELMMGLSKQMAEDIDTKIVDDVRSFLFAPTMSVGMDLVALNIQRGRDHGLPDYNAARISYGLEAVEDLTTLSSDAEVTSALASLYPSIAQLDSWVGSLVEPHVPGASVGPLVMASMVDQFERLRDGDRFFYTHDADLLLPEYAEVINLDQVTLSEVIMLNSGLTQLSSNVFVVPEPSGAYLLLVAFLMFSLGERQVRIPPIVSASNARD